MKINMGAHAKNLFRSATWCLWGAATLVVGVSCVSKGRYDEALAQTKYYQRQYQDLDSYQGRLEAENERMKGELGLFRGQTTIEATATADIDVRLAELRRMMEAIGAPGQITVLAVEGGYGLRLSDAILFDSGSAEIKPEGRELLLEMAGQITARPFERIWVRGHTDSDPVVKAETRERFPHGNLQLSAARAIAVAALLVEEGGISVERVVVAGFGPSDPVGANTTEEGKRKNRRVDIFVIEDPAAVGAR